MVFHSKHGMDSYFFVLTIVLLDKVIFEMLMQISLECLLCLSDS